MKYKTILVFLFCFNAYSQDCVDFINSSSHVTESSFFSVGEIFVMDNKILEFEKPNTNPLAFPNPTTGIVNIKFIEDSEDDFIEIYDITGRYVRNIEFHKNSTIDMTDLSIGIYFIKSKLNMFSTFKIIKK